MEIWLSNKEKRMNCGETSDETSKMYSGRNTTQERIEQNAFLLGLLSNCLIRKRVKTCPLADMVLKTTDEKLVFIEELSDKEIVRILSYHQKCFAKHTKKYRRYEQQDDTYKAH